MFLLLLGGANVLQAQTYHTNGQTLLINPTGRTLLIERDNEDSWLTFHDPGEYWYSMGIDRSNDGALSLNFGGILNSSEFVMSRGGNVGIGVGSPAARLEVKGLPGKSSLKLDYFQADGSFSSRAVFGGHGFQSFSSYNGAAGEPRFVFSKTRGSIDNTIPVQSGDDLGAIWWTPSNDKGSYNHAAKINAVAVGAQTNGITPARIDFSTTAVGSGNTMPSVRMSINHDGNVGIGITAPGRYKLNVNGPVRANEVVVNTSGADFVFADDYALPSLQQVESFIKENRHLPEIPSAAEMQENGLHLAEMNIKLLQKVEELTLYLLEQQKQIMELQSEVEILKSKN